MRGSLDSLPRLIRISIGYMNGFVKYVKVYESLE
jgi:hypothetical protein